MVHINKELDCCFLAVLSLGRPLAQHSCRLKQQQHMKDDVKYDEAPIDYDIRQSKRVMLLNNEDIC